MKPKLVIFDLDGVLVEAKELHYRALNIALGKEYEISWEEHLSTYDGLKTMQKLEMLSERKGLPKTSFKSIWSKKQSITLEELQKIEINPELIHFFKYLSDNEIRISVCSNSVRKTVNTVLSRLNIIQYVDLIVSNEDVRNSKPHPEMYWKAISNFGLHSDDVIIYEDSPYGLQAAARTNARIFRVNNTKDVTLDSFKSYCLLNKNSLQAKIPKWTDRKLNIVIPMAGAGSRFANAGYTFPKPLIEVDKRPMIQVVVENLNIEANYIFIVQKKHRLQYNLDTLLNVITPNCTIVEVDTITEGAACTALLAREYIDNDQPLFFANSDQFVEWDSNEFFYKMNETNVDGGVVTFKSLHPKWSFAKLDKDNFVCEIAEKNPISDNATVGFYYWKRGSDFVKYADIMINKNDRVNNEFYVAPVYNHAIRDGKKIVIKECETMWGLGTPEDLNYFIEHKL